MAKMENICIYIPLLELMFIPDGIPRYRNKSKFVAVGCNIYKGGVKYSTCKWVQVKQPTETLNE